MRERGQEVKPSISDALAARGKSFPARNNAAAPIRALMVDGGVFALRWRCLSVSIGKLEGPLPTLTAVGSNEPAYLVSPPSISLTPPSNVLAQGCAACAVSWHSAATRDIQRRAAVRLVLRSAPVACRRLGGFATWRLLTMAWLVVVTVTVHFLR